MAVAAAATTVQTAINGLTVTTVEADVANAVSTLMDTLAAACADPSDAIRLLSGVVTFQPRGPEPGSTMGSAMADLYRRSAIVSLATVAAVYQPQSYDDANARIRTIGDAIDAESLIAGDEGEDGTYRALRSLRAAVASDLGRRGASLAPIQTFSLGAALPALTLAQRLYRDPDRAEQLVTQADPVSPLFMPTELTALAA